MKKGQEKSTTKPRVLTVRNLAGYLRVHLSTVYGFLSQQKTADMVLGRKEEGGSQCR